MPTERLAAWLIEQCGTLGLSYRQASIRAGVASNTISEIISSGSTPGLERLLKLAKFFKVPPEYLIRMLTDMPSSGLTEFDKFPPAIQFRVREVLQLWQWLAEHDPARADELIQIVHSQATFAKSLVEKKEPTSQPS